MVRDRNQIVARTKTSAKTAAIPKPKKLSLSNEHVVSSESDGDIASSKAIPSSLRKIPAKTTKPGSEGNSKHAATSGSKVNPTPVTEVSPPSENGSENISDTSDSDAEDESDAELLDAPASEKPTVASGKTNGVKRKAIEDVAEDRSASGHEITNSHSTKTKRPKLMSEYESNEISVDRETKASSGKIATTAFIPPKDYQHLDQLSTVPLASFRRDVAGKKVWHIVAPASVPLHSVAEMSADVIAGKAPLVSHRGVSYVLREDSGNVHCRAMAAFPAPDGVEFASEPIAQIFHLQQRLDVPNISKRQTDVNTGSAAAANIGQASINAIRPQPKGLRMRYKPPGFGAGDPGAVGSDEESEGGDDAEQSGQGLQFPKSLGIHDASTDHAVATPSGERSKKTRHTKEHAPEGAIVGSPTKERGHVNGFSKEGRAKQKQDKAKRKEEKAKRKEEKAKRKEEEARRKEEKAKNVKRLENEGSAL